MNYVLYNPLSRNGKGKTQKKKYTKLIKKILANDTEFSFESLIDLDYKALLAKITPDDKVIFVGGDGTLNKISNTIDFKEYPYDNIYLLKYGTGNDFIRSLETKEKLIKITNYLKNLPEVTYNNTTQKFINGVGIGLDGLIVHIVNTGKNKNKLAYFKAAFKAFKRHKPNDIILNIDNKEYKFSNAWLAVVMNSQYFGGGMKMCPDARRDDKLLYIGIIHTITRRKLFWIFPSIYKGKHIRYKNYVTILNGYNIDIKCNSKWYLQIDGDEISNLNTFQVKTF